MEPEPARDVKARDVAFGAAAVGTKAAAAAGRLTLLPLRVAGRTPVVGSLLRRASAELASSGRTARSQAGAAAAEVLAAPEVAGAVDRALAGPLPDAVARSVAEHRVVDRVAPEVLASADFREALAAALENESVDRAVEEVLASPRVEQLVAELIESRLTIELTERVVESRDVQRAMGQLVASPELRHALQRQTMSLAQELAAIVRRRANAFDDGLERAVRRAVRRPRPEGVAEDPIPFGGLLAHAIAFGVDLALIALIGLITAGFLDLVASLFNHVRPGWLPNVVGGATLLIACVYLVFFWTTVGESPGLRVMSLRVATVSGEPPSVGRSLLRFIGVILAIIPLFAGYLPVLFDDRRRALPDYIARTVVVKTDAALAVAGVPAPAAVAAEPLVGR